MKKKLLAAICLLLVAALCLPMTAINSKADGDTGKTIALDDVVKAAFDADRVNDTYDGAQLKNNNFSSYPLLYPNKLYYKDGDTYKSDFYRVVGDNEEEYSPPTTSSGHYGDDNGATISITTIDDKTYPTITIGGNTYTGRKPFEENWNTTDSLIQDTSKAPKGHAGIKGHYEWLNSETGQDLKKNVGRYNKYEEYFGSSYVSKFDSEGYLNPFVELNANVMGTFYQTIATKPGDIIVWRLGHAARYPNSTNGVRDNGEVMIVNIGIGLDDYNAVYAESGVTSNGGYGYSTTTKLHGLTVTQQDGWMYPSGIYKIPANQNSTFFGFESITNDTTGNFLDDIVFATLLGDLSFTLSDSDGDGNDDTIIINGYWGMNPDEAEELVGTTDVEYEFTDEDGNTYVGKIDMSDLNNKGYFEVEINLPDGIVPEDVTAVELAPEGYKDRNFNAFIVDFDLNGHDDEENTPNMQRPIALNEKATDPSEDNKEGLNNPKGYKINETVVEEDGVEYYFKGWFEKNSDSDELEDTPFNFDTPITENKHLFAKWSSDVYTVKFDTQKTGVTNPADQTDFPNSGTGQAVEPSEYVEDETFIKDTDNNKYYVFKGWYKDSNTSEGQKYNFDTEKVTGDITLFAKWEECEGVELSFNLNGHGSDTPSPQYYPSNTSAGEKPTDPTAPGYRFEGWYTDPDCTEGKEYKFDDEGGEALGESKTIYAKWSPAVEVKFESKIEGTAVPVPNKQVGFDPAIPDYAKNPVKDDSNTPSIKAMYTENNEYTMNGKVYRFDGWYTGEGGTGDKFVFGDGAGSTDISVDTTLYAKWTYVRDVFTGGIVSPPSTPTTTPTHKVEFVTPIGPKPSDQEGFTGTTPATNPTTVLKPGDEVDGNIFEGWYEDPEFTKPFDFTKPITEDKKAYAKWKEKEKEGTGTEEKPDGEKPEDTTDTEEPTKPEDPAKPSDPTKPADPTKPTDTTTPAPNNTPAKEPVKVTFKTEIGVTPEMQTLTPGTTAVDPKAPMDPTSLKPGTVINGYRFAGWYLDPEFKIPFDFSTAISEDTVLYAKWVAVGSSSPKTGVEDYYGFAALLVAALMILGFVSLKPRKRDRFS